MSSQTVTTEAIDQTTTEPVFGFPCPAWCTGEHEFDKMTERHAVLLSDKLGVEVTKSDVTLSHVSPAFKTDVDDVLICRDDIHRVTGQSYEGPTTLIYGDQTDITPAEARTIAAALIEASFLAEGLPVE